MKYREAKELGIIDFLIEIYKKLKRSPRLIRLKTIEDGRLIGESILGTEVEPDLLPPNHSIFLTGQEEPEDDGIYFVESAGVLNLNYDGDRYKVFSAYPYRRDLRDAKLHVTVNELLVLTCGDELKKKGLDLCLNRNTELKK